MQGEVDLVGVLHVLVHGFRLPPGSIRVTTEVGHVVRCVRRFGAHVACLLGHLASGLNAELGSTGHAARVGRFHRQTERRVLEPRYTSLRTHDYKRLMFKKKKKNA